MIKKETLRPLKNYISSYPSNTILLPDSSLFYLLEQFNYLGSSMRENILAELLCRYWLYRFNNVKLSNFVAKFFSSKQLKEYKRLTQPLREKKQKNNYLNNKTLINNDFLNNILKRKLQHFLEADGIIPVVDLRYNEALPIPFRIIRSFKKEHLVVTDIKGQINESWSEYLKEIKSQYRTFYNEVKLHIIFDDNKKMDGNSLELPVLLALAAKECKLQYLSLDILATGSFAFNHKLSKVNKLDAKAALAEKMGISMFIMPDDKKSYYNAVPIPLYKTVDQTLKFVKEKLTVSGIHGLSWREATADMKKLDSDVQAGQIDYKIAQRKLKELKRVFIQKNREEEILKSDFLKIKIHRHLGKTKESLTLTKTILSKINEKQDIDTFIDRIKLLIGEIVSLSDIGLFESVDSNGREIYEKIFSNKYLSKGQKNELLTHFHGTMGQSYLFGSIQLENNVFKQKSLDHFKKACQIADELEDEKEKARDLNYIHFWYATYKFDTDKEKNLYEKCLALATKQENTENNLSHLFRQRAYGASRRLLQEEDIPLFEKLECPPQKDWTLAMFYKYRGTLFAAQRNYKNAYNDFTQGIDILSNTDHELLYLLCMTIAVQSWQSLMNTEFHSFALDCKKKALAFFSNKKILETYFFAIKWKEFLENKITVNPQLRLQW